VDNQPRHIRCSLTGRYNATAATRSDRRHPCTINARIPTTAHKEELSACAFRLFYCLLYVAMAWSFVCLASRGIGFALTQHLLQTTKIRVIATARRDVEGVKKSILSGLPGVDSDRLTVLELNATDNLIHLQHSNLYRYLTISTPHRTKPASPPQPPTPNLFPPQTSHLRLALAIPGILHAEKPLSQVDAQHCHSTFRTNTISPLLLIKHFSPFLPKKKTPIPPTTTTSFSSGPPPHAVWATMSAHIGSTSDNSLGGWYSYRVSKAGVNSITKTFGLYPKNSSGEKAIAVALHPGTVKTALSKECWGMVEENYLRRSLRRRGWWEW
jgi:NAD(P)-dependent dehydrogenase (short-subunit alcohol dehydrogenase family)